MSIFYSIMTCVAARCVKNQKLSGFIVDVITAIIWFQYGVQGKGGLLGNGAHLVPETVTTIHKCRFLARSL